MSERSMETYREALSRITDAAFGKRGAPSFASIPARPEHDADLLLADALDALERLRRERDAPIPAEETIAGLRAQLAAVTADRDRLLVSLTHAHQDITTAEAERDALAADHRWTAAQALRHQLGLAIMRERTTRRTARHLLAWQQARGMEAVRVAVDGFPFARITVTGQQAIDELRAERDTLRAENERLQEALERLCEEHHHLVQTALSGGGSDEASAPAELGRLLDEAGLHVYAHKPGCSMDDCACRAESLAPSGGGR